MTLFIPSQHPVPLSKDGLVFIKNGDHVLHKKISNHVFFPQDRLSLSEIDIKNAIYIGSFNNKKIFALEKDGIYYEELTYTKSNLLLYSLTPETRKALFRSCQLLNWHNQSLFCSCCGNRTHIDTIEFVKICDANPQHRTYPQYSPSIIVLVKHGTKLLLGRSPHFTKGMYSTLAGFIEAGETAEDAVKREVMEEVGIEIKNIRPVSTSPWPFPNSLMLGFEADAVTYKLTINKEEIEDAQWFEYDNLPPLPPKATISYELIERGVNECKQIRNLHTVLI